MPSEGRPHPSKQGFSPAPNAGTVAGVFAAIADGLENGTVTTGAASLVLREYSKMLWGSVGGKGEPDAMGLKQRRPIWAATYKKGWAGWSTDRYDRFVACGHSHRSREAAIRCVKGRGRSGR